MIGILDADDYYQRPSSSSQAPVRGRLCWAPILHLFGEPTQKYLAAHYDRQQAKDIFQAQRLNPTDFDSSQNQNPVKELDLRSDERAVILPAKKRPVIVLARTPKKDQPDELLVAPVYSFPSNARFPEFVKAYQYPHYFYLPASSLHKQFTGGFVRLDRLQALAETWLEPMRLELSESVLGLLRDWFRVYLGESVDDVNPMLAEYRREAEAASF